jgi:hypothetical protein
MWLKLRAPGRFSSEVIAVSFMKFDAPDHAVWPSILVQILVF